MNAFVWLTLVQISLTSVFAGDNCEGLNKNLETACEFPNTLTLISSPNKNKVDEKNCNAEYMKSEWQKEPTIMFPGAVPDKTYTLMNIDPDPPAYQKGQYYLHWLVSNIKGEDFIKGDLSKANHVTSYYGPAPPVGSGIHRYMFVVFEEKDENQKVDTPNSRSRFEPVPWFQKQDNLCGPVAGIQFRTTY